MAAACLIVLPEEGDPAAVGDLTGHIIRRYRVLIGGAPPQGVDEAHGREVLLPAGVHKAQRAAHRAGASCA